MACADAPSRPRVAILADDLTGAADAAAPFAERGYAVLIALSDVVTGDAEVVALVTDSRWRPAAEAADRVATMASRLRSWQPDVLFLKVDSTLRGRVHADVAVALAAWGCSSADATPAFPAQGRTVRNGALLVNGDTVVPVVADRFPLGVRVHDAQSHEDLLAIARDIIASGTVAVGSGGLARAVAQVLAARPGVHSATRAGAAGVLIVAGTTHAVTQAQVAAFVGAGGVHMVLDRSVPSPAGAAVAALREGGRVVLTCRCASDIEPDSAASVALAEDIAGTVGAIIAQAPSAGLVLTGGATALAVARALRATQLRLLSEVAPGLPLGVLVVGDRRIPVVTKSGGFGAPDYLNRATEALEASA